MRTSEGAASIGSKSGDASKGALKIEPLPWPAAQVPNETAHLRHGHRCIACANTFECQGPEETGFCTPVCQPCYWVELGTQLRVYREVVSELARKSKEIEQRVGREAIRVAEARRLKTSARADVLVALDSVLMAGDSLR